VGQVSLLEDQIERYLESIASSVEKAETEKRIRKSEAEEIHAFIDQISKKLRSHIEDIFAQYPKKQRELLDRIAILTTENSGLKNRLKLDKVHADHEIDLKNQKIASLQNFNKKLHCDKKELTNDARDQSLKFAKEKSELESEKSGINKLKDFLRKSSRWDNELHKKKDKKIRNLEKQVTQLEKRLLDNGIEPYPTLKEEMSDAFSQI